jgi:hypothetical protein
MANGVNGEWREWRMAGMPNGGNDEWRRLRVMRRLVVIAMLVAVPAVLRATVLVPIEFRELVTVASTIVRGRVVDVRAQWVDGRRAIDTVLTVEADEYFKGGPGATIFVRVPGGEMGRYRTVFVGAPEFRRGDEVVLFLRGDPARGAVIVGLSQGAFRVAPDRTGRRMVTTPVLMGTSSDRPQPVVRGDVTRRPLAVEAFGDLVRRVAAGGAAR